jgi:prefoldin alpha subunit
MEERREISPEIQEKLLRLQQLQLEAENIQKRIFEMEIAESELDKTLETLEYFEGLEDGVDALMNLGAGVFAYVDVKESKKMLVDVGAGVVIEREVKEVIDLLKKRKEKVQRGKEQYVQLLERVYSQAQQVQKEIAELSKSQK